MGLATELGLPEPADELEESWLALLFVVSQVFRDNSGTGVYECSHCGAYLLPDNADSRAKISHACTDGHMETLFPVVQVRDLPDLY